MAADLIGRKVDLLATLSGTPSALVAKTATSTIPIVFFTGGDPVTEVAASSPICATGRSSWLTFRQHRP
jgi:putative ABC transport system substrate-binding protein